MTDEDLMKISIAYAENGLAKGGIMQAFIAEMPAGKLTVAACPWSNELERRMILRSLRDFIANTGCTRAVFVSEVWQAEAAPGMEGIQPRDREDKQEMVMICSMADDRDAIMHNWPIVRDAAGARMGEKRVLPDGIKYGGSIPTLIPRKAETKETTNAAN